ncbi:MAG: NADH-quinone oxidoreductase subunit N [Acidimicrobiales bacterium]
MIPAVLAPVAGQAAAAATTFKTPYFDYHALAPEIVLTAVILIVLVLDLVVDESHKHLVTQVAGIGILASFVPVLTLAVAGISGHARSMFGGAYVVDVFSLVMKALFLGVGYVILLMSTNYIEEGDYYEGEFAFLILCSLLGMVVMSSSRDLISIFIALELLSIPGYLLAGWRKRDLKSNEGSMKYYLLGVLATGVMLYGMSLIFGATGSTVLSTIGSHLAVNHDLQPLVTIGIFFVIIGFAFKVSAVPFHFWAPDTYEGAPTPVTAFLSVASKTGGFVALFELVYVGFFSRADVWQPLFWILAALTMTVGNLIALRQTNIVRMLAYSSIAQAGYILVPFAVAGNIHGKNAQDPITASIVYLLLYAAMNLGAFAIVITVARRTRSGEISSYGGLVNYAPGLTLMMTIFLFSLAGIPPLGGWFAKYYVFRAVADANTPAAWILGVLVAVNSVIALVYYANVGSLMWTAPVPAELVPVPAGVGAVAGASASPGPDGAARAGASRSATGAKVGVPERIRVPASLATAIGICAAVVVVLGVYPQVFARLGDLAHLTH